MDVVLVGVVEKDHNIHGTQHPDSAGVGSPRVQLIGGTLAEVSDCRPPWKDLHLDFLTTAWISSVDIHLGRL